MEKAIITGATGLLGSDLVNFLFEKKIDILAIGRRELNKEDKSVINPSVKYLNLDLHNIENLPDHLDKINFKIDRSCVFFNFAWGGIKTLTDGDYNNQIKNAIIGSKAIKIASQIGCQKFINVGTLQETIIENYLKTSYPNECYESQLNYSLAKIASRDLCKMTAYLEKIDYVHTRLSIPLDPTLTKGSYFSNTLKKILEGKNYEAPKSNKLFDVIFLNEVSEAYYLIGKYGKNKSDYFIGTGNPMNFENYFRYFKGILSRNKIDDLFEFDISSKDREVFNTEPLKKDTGFQAVKSFKDILSYH